MATILFLQPIASLVAAAIALISLVTLGRNAHLRADGDHIHAGIFIDKMWRLCVGLGAAPALVTFYLRLGMPESPRYIIWVSPHRRLEEGEDINFDFRSLKDYFRTLGGYMKLKWHHLLALSLCAFVFNLAFGGLGLDNYRILADIWALSTPPASTKVPAYSDKHHASGMIGADIYDVLFNNSIHFIITVSAGSVIGSLMMIILVNYRTRRSFLMMSSYVLAGIFLTFAITSRYLISTQTMVVDIVLSGACYLCLNLGPYSISQITRIRY